MAEDLGGCKMTKNVNKAKKLAHYLLNGNR